MLVVVFIFSLQYRSVQTYIAKKAAKYLSKELETRVEIGGLYIKPFKSVVLDSVYIEDREQDTLIFSPKLTVDLNMLSIKQRIVSINTIQMDNGKFHIKQYRDSATNLQFIINYFDTGDPTPRKKPRKPYNVTMDKIVLNNIAFKYQNFNNTTPVKGVNFNDIDLRNLSTTILGLDTKNHLVKAGFRNLTLREKSGFYLKNLTTDATIDTNQMEFSNLLLETPTTRLSDYLLMKYGSFKDFGKFISKVYLKVNLKNSKINSSDITYFVPQLAKANILMDVDGQATGYVNDLKAKNLAIRTGQATYLKGDFNIKGLPNLKNTRLDLRFDQLSTNKKDLDLIIARATGRKGSMIPPIANKFGTVNFKGRFNGFTNDFIASGEIKTRLGRVVTNLNMKIDGTGYPRYSGLVKAYDFNLGELLDRRDLGRTTLTANITGSGFNVNSLQERIRGDIRYFDYNGYRYSNINVNGSFNNKLFKGLVKVNDRNIKLNFDGSVDLKPKLPIFNFSASILGANLHKLNFTKDTVQIDANVKTNFTGSNLDNIQGNFAINSIRITNPDNSFVVDSLNLSAIGIGANRELKIASDILDASIKGEYDLKTFPSYFKSVAAQYIPSLNLKYVKPGPQNFEFTLKIKYFEPLSALIMPALKIPEGANFNGKFVSAENIANLNGFAELIQFNNIKINNLIIDESTSAEAMNIFITSDRIDLTDSLYIKNVNIANILRNDSLNLNIKLSDKDATNQLDLNSLVEFTSSGPEQVRLSVLPSDVIINREVWKIQEKVSFSFDEGRKPNDKFSLFRRTKITGFELFRDNQMLTIDGIISKDPADELLIGFNKFKLTTFNPLTLPSGIALTGELNGDAKFAGILAKPDVEAELTIDTLHYNKVLIGDLALKAGFDNSTRLINVDVDIENQGLKTLEIDGTYNANSDENSLDLNVMMNENEVIIFQPFLKNLVSDMNGKVSANLEVTGKLTSPKINGTVAFNDAGMIVNYLKTPYRITDEIKVEDSKIVLNSLKLRDINNTEALVNGTVDMANPMNPEIQIDIVANDPFMALNTTAKDNPLYYGTAYGTGVFSFSGPTNDMRINIDAKTEEGTVFTIPLNSSATVAKNDFITFVAKDSALNKPKVTSFKGLVMNLSLQVDEASEVNIITDLGKLSGRGNSENLRLNITSLGDFEMFGSYLITSGKFEFTAQDFINKVFKINEGGSIRWTGNPQEAAINLKAIYEVRASLRPLYIAAGRPPLEQRVPSEAVMNLSGPLLTPTIAFDINFPSDAYIKDELQSYFNDVNNVNQQALSLIVRRSFAEGSGASIDVIQSTFLNAGTEMIFNRLNTVISQYLNLNTVDFNIRSFNDASATLRLLNERLVLTGGVTDRRANNDPFADFNVFGGSDVARDVEAQYLIKRDGSLVLRASNKLNNRNPFLNINSNGDYVSAIGLVYRKDFDDLNELLGFLLGKNRSEERRKEAEAPKTNTVATKPEDATKPEETAVPKNK